MLAQALEFIRSLSFGALVVNAVFLLVFRYYPNLFPSNFSHREVLAVGTLIGTVLHRALHAALFNPLTRSVARGSAFYSKLLELYVSLRQGWISERQFEEYSDNLKNEYYGLPIREILAAKTDKRWTTTERGEPRLRAGRLEDGPRANPQQVQRDQPIVGEDYQEPESQEKALFARLEALADSDEKQILTRLQERARSKQ